MEMRAERAAEDVAFEAKLAFLGGIDAFRGHIGTGSAADRGAAPQFAGPTGRAGAVERIETHLSWVFIAGDRVFKLKKPLRLEFVDFSSVALRERDSVHQEVQAAKRLVARLENGGDLAV